MKKKSIISKLIFWLNLLAAIALLFSYAAAYIKPQPFWPLAFFGLAFPYLLGINFLFLLFWTFKGSSKLFLPLVVISLGYKTIPAFVQLHFDESINNEESIKVMSFNVRVFDLYMWTKEKTTRNQIFAFLDREDPDIICLQEFYHSDQQDVYEFKTLDTLKQFLTAKNYHFHTTSTLRKTDHWGVITFSKYPIQAKGVVPFATKGDNVCTYTDIVRDGKTIRVYNAHLASIKLDKHDYKAIKAVNANQYSDDFGKELMVLNKVKAGFIQRSQQADSIRKHLDHSPFPSLLMGDFNDTPASYAYRKIKGNMQDAFMEAGSGFGLTYIGDFPSFRIDYILYDSSFKAISYQTHPEKLSDHHPISAKLLMPS